MNERKPHEWRFEMWPKNPSFGVHPRSPGIKVIHLPSGLEATCTMHRSMFKNRDECIRQIESRLA